MLFCFISNTESCNKMLIPFYEVTGQFKCLHFLCLFALNVFAYFFCPCLSCDSEYIGTGIKHCKVLVGLYSVVCFHSTVLMRLGAIHKCSHMTT